MTRRWERAGLFVPAGRWVLTGMLLITAGLALGLVPEPDAVYYGECRYDSNALPAGSQVRATAGGQTLDEYEVAPAGAGAGNMFVLRVPLDSGEPRVENKIQVGEEVTIGIRRLDGASLGAERIVGRLRVDERGMLARLDFDALPRGADTPVPILTPQRLDGTDITPGATTPTPTFTVNTSTPTHTVSSPTPTPTVGARHPADTNGNQRIDTSELIQEIQRWKNFEATTPRLVQTIQLWSSQCTAGGVGCYCPDSRATPLQFRKGSCGP